ncbi:uncharacterized protein LOC101453834 [Ceratitis capitata]|uniref:(Mediterranean fruit fly) hypothetical protein n=1 Tax=Ceratitis capitata TaxID=7213 RepID=A0A811UD19_CERCA|nr:uncharacterized protein LOC101453834 [Ceratitis capitata]CAD6996711.1 unnamed protein product [Ceratitis capitata]
MRLLYGESDEKFVSPKASELIDAVKEHTNIDEYNYKENPFVRVSKGSDIDKNSLPIVFKVSPDTLLNMAALVADRIPLPSVYDWSIEDVCRWIRKFGYRQYQNTFRVNLITGRKLLLVDATALTSMNIKNFEDIKRISYGIRQLFYFEMTKFMHSISLPPQYYNELYKLFRTKSGYTFDITKRSELWRRMQLIRKSKPYLSHWDTLERWLMRARETEPELFGGVPHYRLYRCNVALKPTAQMQAKQAVNACTCMPPCFCYHTERHFKPPTVFSLLKATRTPDQAYTCPKERCSNGVPPCTCHWKSSHYKFNQTLSCLRKELPHRYGNRKHTMALSFLDSNGISRPTLI